MYLYPLKVVIWFQLLPWLFEGGYMVSVIAMVICSGYMLSVLRYFICFLFHNTIYHNNY